METTRLLNPLTDLSNLSHWDRVLLHVLGKVKGGVLRLTLPDGQVTELGQGKGESVELRMMDKDLARVWLLGGSMALAESFIEGK